MSRKKAEFKVAKTFGEILKDKNSLYEVFRRPKKGINVKRFLTRGCVDRYGRIILSRYNVYGDVVAWGGLVATRNLQETNKAKKENKTEYYNELFFTSKEEAYNSTIHQLRLKKLELNKQIAQLQNELYSVE